MKKASAKKVSAQKELAKKAAAKKALPKKGKPTVAAPAVAAIILARPGVTRAGGGCGGDAVRTSYPVCAKETPHPTPRHRGQARCRGGAPVPVGRGNCGAAPRP